MKQGGLVVRKASDKLMQIMLPKALSELFTCTFADDENGRQRLAYMGMNQTTHKWVEIPTYGGKLTENVVSSHRP